MVLIHKKTAEIYELRFKSVDSFTEYNEHISYDMFITYGIGEIVLLGREPVNCTPNQLADQFEILGCL